MTNRARGVVLTAAVALTACNAGPELAPTSGVPMYRAGETGRLAALGGELRFVDGCLVVTAGDEDIAVLWPVPTSNVARAG